MSRLSKSVVSLRVGGSGVLPERVTALLGAQPSMAYRKGEEQVTSAGTSFVRPIGLRLLRAREAEPEDIDAQVAELLGRMSQDLSAWRALASEFKVDLFLGLFMEGTNEGFTLSPQTLSSLAERHVEVGFDLYAPGPEQLAEGNAEA